MKLQIRTCSCYTRGHTPYQAGKCVAECTPADLLSTLTSRDVLDEVAQSLIRVRVAAGEEDLAEVDYDAGTAHEDGQDWETLAAGLAERALSRLA